MQLAVARADGVFQDDYVVTEIARASRGAYDTALGGDAADSDRADAAAPFPEVYRFRCFFVKLVTNSCTPGETVSNWRRIGSASLVMSSSASSPATPSMSL